MHGFRNSLKLLSRCMNGQLNPSCTIKFSLNCQQFFFFSPVLGNLFISPTMCHHQWGRPFNSRPAISVYWQAFHFASFHKRGQKWAANARPLEKWRLVANTSSHLYYGTIPYHTILYHCILPICRHSATIDDLQVTPRLYSSQDEWWW